MICYICMGFYRECSETFCSATVRERHHRLQQLLTICIALLWSRFQFPLLSATSDLLGNRTYTSSQLSLPRVRFPQPSSSSKLLRCCVSGLCLTPTVATSCHTLYRSSLMTYTNLRPYGIFVRPMVRFLIARHLFLIDLEPLY